jgi:hypothetical protein
LGNIITYYSCQRQFTYTPGVSRQQVKTLLYIPAATCCPSDNSRRRRRGYNVSHISVVCIKSLPRRRGKYLLFMTHINDGDIPHVWHRLNQVHRTMALQEFLETPHGTRLPRRRRTSTSCTLTESAFMSPSNGFDKGA